MMKEIQGGLDYGLHGHSKVDVVGGGSDVDRRELASGRGEPRGMRMIEWMSK